MSLGRLIYYSAIVGGWSAFLGWLISEFTLSPGSGHFSVALVCALVGAAIGMGLNLLAGMANARLSQQLKRVVPGLLAGGAGGALGGFLGDILVSVFGPDFRAIGWMVMGAGIGVAEGLYERSPAKLRNGLVGGAIGGLVGGLLFKPISLLMASSATGMSSRATAFVILGMCIGILIALVKVVLKDAWLTVLDGYRPGRQLILSDAQTVLGRAEYAALPFMGRNDAALDLVHAKIIRRTDGRFTIEDNKTKEGTRLNNVRIDGPALLSDGDVIRVGYNSIKFSERHRKAGEVSAPAAAAPTNTAALATKPPVPAAPAVTKPVVAAAPPAMKSPAAAQAPKPIASAVKPPAAAQAPKPMATSAPLAATASALPVAPQFAPDGSPLCPGCKKPVPKGQRYCIVCDIYF